MPDNLITTDIIHMYFNLTSSYKHTHHQLKKKMFQCLCLAVLHTGKS